MSADELSNHIDVGGSEWLIAMLLGPIFQAMLHIPSIVHQGVLGTKNQPKLEIKGLFRAPLHFVEI
jgi:hypothetical protein